MNCSACCRDLVAKYLHLTGGDGGAERASVTSVWRRKGATFYSYRVYFWTVTTCQLRLKFAFVNKMKAVQITFSMG